MKYKFIRPYWNTSAQWYESISYILDVDSGFRIKNIRAWFKKWVFK